MNTTLTIFGLISLAFPYLASIDDGPLLHWKFDEGQGRVAPDASGHGHNGQIGATWSLSAPFVLTFDGTSTAVVSTELPLGSRLGKGSWTVSAWIQPGKFSIDSRQNQRRLFAYGSYPKAFFCVDLLASGAPTLYECYEIHGNSHSAGSDCSTRLALAHWAFLAVVCDQSKREFKFFVNGVQRGRQAIPADFDPDLNISGEFTVGNGWQSYCGYVSEVQLFNRAEKPSEIRAEFTRLQDRFNVESTPEERAADELEAIQGWLEDSDRAWAKKDYSTARNDLSRVVGQIQAPANIRSYAHLRLAQSYLATGDRHRTRSEYARIAANTDYPDVHRQEAKEHLAELDRVAKGLPSQNPADHQVTVSNLPPITTRLFVSPAGKDSNPGTANRPIATLSAARDWVRTLRPRTIRGTIEVSLAPGEYRIAKPVDFGVVDSGSGASPVVYRAEKPGTAVLYGGTKVSGFKPVTDPAVLDRLPAESRGKVVQADLRALGIKDFGALAVRGFGQAPSPPTLELYVNQQPQTLARWPNAGFVSPTKLVDPGDINRGTPSVLAYENDRPSRWSKAEDPWIFGYFQFLWADGTAKIAKIDSQAKSLTTAAAYHYLGSGMSTEQGIKYYAFNLLEEIDTPGEWYLNRQTGILYLYPPSNLATSTVEISLLNTPMVTADHLSHVRFEGLTFDLGRGDGVILKDSHDCQMVGCTVRRLAGNGVSVLGGSKVTLLSCDIYNIGRRATEIIGGDRPTLTPGGHIVANCKIHDFGRIDRTYTPGVQLEGVGNRVVHNLFYNCPSSAMRIEGNDHVMEYNEVHDVLKESDDQGSMELYGNPTYRGVVFRYNYYHHLGSGKQDRLVNGQAAIRLDDAISGMLIYGNVFDRAANGAFGGVQINSGRDNIIDNNVFAEAEKGISGGFYPGNAVWSDLGSANKPAALITNELYLKRYPALGWALKEPGVNHVWRNVFYKIRQDMTGNLSSLDQIGNVNISSQNRDFVNASTGSFSLRSNSPVLQSAGFRPIPFGEIGLYRDGWRKNLN